MSDTSVMPRPWPPAFSEDFLADARRRFEAAGHLLVVGPLASNRGALARAVAGDTAPVAWGRDAHALGARRSCYATLNHLLPTLRARPDQSVEEVTARADAVLDATFGSPVVLLREVDLCDAGSVEVVAHLMASGRLSVVATSTTTAAVEHLRADPAAVVELPPLDASTVADLITSRFGATPHPTTVGLLLQRSQGAYAVLKELTDACVRTGQLKVLSGQLVVDDSVSNDEVDRAATASTVRWAPRFPTGHPAREVVEVASLLSEIDTTEAVAAFGQEMLQAAIDGGLLLCTGDTVTVASLVEAMTLVRDLDTARRVELYQRYAGLLPRTLARSHAAPRAASWLLSAGQPLSLELASGAATQANRECRYVDVLRFVESVPAGERTSRLLVEQGHALNESGDAAGLAAMLRSFDATRIDVDHLLPFLRWCSETFPTDESAGRRDGLAASLAPDDPRSPVLELFALSQRLYVEDFELFRQDLRSLIRSGGLSPVNAVAARSLLADACRHAGQIEGALTASDEAVAMLDGLDRVPSAHLLESTLEVQIMCRLTAHDFEGARAALSAYSSPVVGHGTLGRLGTALWGLYALALGDIDTAMAHARLCLAGVPPSDPHRVRSWLEAVSAQVLVQVGDIEQVYALLESSMGRPPTLVRPFDLLASTAQAFVHDIVGDPEQAIGSLTAIVEEARAHGFALEEIEAAALLVQVGGPVHLPVLARAVEPLDETRGAPAVWARFARAMGLNDMHDLVRLAEELDEAGNAMVAAAVAQFTLDVARRAADMSPAQRRRLTSIASPVQHRHVSRDS